VNRKAVNYVTEKIYNDSLAGQWWRVWLSGIPGKGAARTVYFFQRDTGKHLISPGIKVGRFSDRAHGRISPGYFFPVMRTAEVSIAE